MDDAIYVSSSPEPEIEIEVGPEPDSSRRARIKARARLGDLAGAARGRRLRGSVRPQSRTQVIKIDIDSDADEHQPTSRSASARAHAHTHTRTTSRTAAGHQGPHITDFGADIETDTDDGSVGLQQAPPPTLNLNLNLNLGASAPQAIGGPGSFAPFIRTRTRARARAQSRARSAAGPAPRMRLPARIASRSRSRRARATRPLPPRPSSAAFADTGLLGLGGWEGAWGGFAARAGGSWLEAADADADDDEDDDIAFDFDVDMDADSESDSDLSHLSSDVDTGMMDMDMDMGMGVDIADSALHAALASAQLPPPLNPGANSRGRGHPDPAPAVPPELLAEATRRVLEVFPDVDPSHATALITRDAPTYGYGVIERVVNALFEDVRYPRAEKKKGKGKGKANEEGDEGGGTGGAQEGKGKGKRRSDEGGDGSGVKKIKVDYADGTRPFVGGPYYEELALEQLRIDFPLIPRVYLKKMLGQFGRLYAPTWIYLEEREERRAEADKLKRKREAEVGVEVDKDKDKVKGKGKGKEKQTAGTSAGAGPSTRAAAPAREEDVYMHPPEPGEIMESRRVYSGTGGANVGANPTPTIPSPIPTGLPPQLSPYDSIGWTGGGISQEQAGIQAYQQRVQAQGQARVQARIQASMQAQTQTPTPTQIQTQMQTRGVPSPFHPPLSQWRAEGSGGGPQTRSQARMQVQTEQSLAALAARGEVARLGRKGETRTQGQTPGLSSTPLEGAQAHIGQAAETAAEALTREFLYGERREARAADPTWLDVGTLGSATVGAGADVGVRGKPGEGGLESGRAEGALDGAAVRRGALERLRRATGRFSSSAAGSGGEPAHVSPTDQGHPLTVDPPSYEASFSQWMQDVTGPQLDGRLTVGASQHQLQQAPHGAGSSLPSTAQPQPSLPSAQYHPYGAMEHAQAQEALHKATLNRSAIALMQSASSSSQHRPFNAPEPSPFVGDFWDVNAPLQVPPLYGFPLPGSDTRSTQAEPPRTRGPPLPIIRRRYLPEPARDQEIFTGGTSGMPDPVRGRQHGPGMQALHASNLEKYRALASLSTARAEPPLAPSQFDIYHAWPHIMSTVPGPSAGSSAQPAPPGSDTELDYVPLATPYRPSPKGKTKLLHDEEFARELAWVQDYKARKRQRQLEAEEEADDGEQEDGIECQCCFSNFVVGKMVQCAEAHFFCRRCIRTHVSALLGTQNVNVKCLHTSGCALPIPESEIMRVLPAKMARLWERVKQRKELEAAGLVGWEECPFCDFGCVMEVSVEQDKLFRCLNEEVCGAVSCRMCKDMDHLPKSCEEHEKDKALDGRHHVEEAMSRALMRNCPKCKKAFVKQSGCNHITCPHCRASSCYICRQLIVPGDGHFTPRRDGTYRCMGDGGSVEELHAREVEEARQRAIAAYKLEHPDVGEAQLQVEFPIPESVRSVAHRFHLNVWPPHQIMENRVRMPVTIRARNAPSGSMPATRW